MSFRFCSSGYTSTITYIDRPETYYIIPQKKSSELIQGSFEDLKIKFDPLNFRGIHETGSGDVVPAVCVQKER